MVSFVQMKEYSPLTELEKEVNNLSTPMEDEKLYSYLIKMKKKSLKIHKIMKN